MNNFCFPVIKKYIWRLKDHKPFPEYPPKWKIRKLMSKARYVAFLLGLILPAIVNAQIGGENTYEFLNLTNSARMAALGGNQVALKDVGDLNTASHNPSLLSEGMNKVMVVNYVDYFEKVGYGYAAYSFKTGLPGNTAIGIHYINYGEFVEALASGEKTGNTFNAAEYAFNLFWSDRRGQLAYGVNLKPILSSFENYQSFGLAADLGLSYFSKNEQTTLGFVLKNVGSQITTYYEGAERETLPFDVQFGVSRKLAHAPVVLSATMQHLQKWDLANETEDKATGEITNEGFGKQFLRHALLGVELLPSPNFSIRAGYNYQRRQELKFDEKVSTVGFSWGFGFKIKRFRLDYGSARYHLAAASNHISLTINLGEGIR